jgi:hypothetical protein
MNVAEISLGGLVLRVVHNEPPPGLYAGDYYPVVTLVLSGPSGSAEMTISPDKAREVSTALRVAAIRSEGKRA